MQEAGNTDTEARVHRIERMLACRETPIGIRDRQRPPQRRQRAIERVMHGIGTVIERRNARR